MGEESTPSVSEQHPSVQDAPSLHTNPELPEREFDADLWLDRIARALGFGWLSDRLPGGLPPSYLYAIVLITTIEPIGNSYAYVAGDTVAYLKNPFLFLQPIALLMAVYGARALRRRYHHVMQQMEIEQRASEPAKLLDIVPGWLPWLFFVASLVLNFTRVLALGGPGVIYEQYGLPVVIGYMVVNPIWATIFAQFLAVYLSIELLAPWRLWHSDVGVHFLDPENLGGLRPFGELIKHTYYYMVAGLTLFALIAYGPVIVLSEMSRTATTNVMFTAVWLGTVLTVAFAVFTLHRFMRREKRDELWRLERLRQEYIQNPWDIKSFSIADGKQETVDEIEQRMERVSATREYPATFSIWSQLLLSIVLPKAFQLLLASI
ncbi:hypothetical protein ACFR9U_20225 [Halorientalis brevis]|uniref:Uncharacterized protein n=1 Tax=Halorientalis brevis TaxID=1126241 RepID=A0ABD6CH06_9EURY|nr:hypothetical protein [Halorientalis brevis]